MALLKEDGSLDVERINSLEFKEYVNEMGSLTNEQVEEYLAKTPVSESKGPIMAIVVESIDEYGVDADDFLKKIREKYGIV